LFGLLQSEADFSHLKYSIYDSKPIVDHFLRDTIKAFREVVVEWEGFESYVPKVERLITDIEAIGRKSYTPNPKSCGFNVLNHGDLHLRNILIKDDSEQRVESFYFVIQSRGERSVMISFDVRTLFAG
jgi:hypothetical protein